MNNVSISKISFTPNKTYQDISSGRSFYYKMEEVKLKYCANEVNKIQKGEIAKIKPFAKAFRHN